MGWGGGSGPKAWQGGVLVALLEVRWQVEVLSHFDSTPLRLRLF